MNDDTIIENSVGEQLLEQIIAEMEAEETDPEAGATGGKRPKKDFPFALYVHKGTIERQVLPRNMF